MNNGSPQSIWVKPESIVLKIDSFYLSFNRNNIQSSFIIIKQDRANHPDFVPIQGKTLSVVMIQIE